MYAIIRANKPEQLPAGAFSDAQGVKHPANVLTLWSSNELAAIGVYRVVDEEIPPGKVATGWSLVFDETSVTRVFDLKDFVPEPFVPTVESQKQNRQVAFAAEADPLFFMWQAGEGTEQSWKTKREEIRARYPYPEDKT